MNSGGISPLNINIILDYGWKKLVAKQAKKYILFIYRRVSYDRSCPVADHSLCGASPIPRGWRHAMFLFYL